jgi:hypothetical protein
MIDDTSLPGETLRDYAIRMTMAEHSVAEEIAAKAVDRALDRTGLPSDVIEPEDGKVVPLRRGAGDQ